MAIDDMPEGWDDLWASFDETIKRADAMFATLPTRSGVVVQRTVIIRRAPAAPWWDRLSQMMKGRRRDR